jgi:hypothetical protein
VSGSSEWGGTAPPPPSTRLKSCDTKLARGTRPNLLRSVIRSVVIRHLPLLGSPHLHSMANVIKPVPTSHTHYIISCVLLDSSVGIVTGRTDGDRFPAATSSFGAHQASYGACTRGSFSGNKAAGA